MSELTIVNGALEKRSIGTPSKNVTAFQPQTAQELMQFAAMIADSDLVPKEMRGRPGNIILAIQQGAELGMKPMQALQSIAVINGRPSLWGDGLLGLVMASELLEDFEEQIECDEKGNPIAAACMVKRVGRTREKISIFSVEDAKNAGLWGKAGPWTQYPKRMLQLRARSFALRDEFPDVLKGMRTAEEALDMAMEIDSAPATAPRDKATAVRDRMREQMGRQAASAGVKTASAASTASLATATASVATANATGTLCPSCHAPAGKPHAKNCKAPVTPPAADPPAPKPSSLGPCPVCGSLDDCACTIEQRDAALRAQDEAEALTPDIFAGE